MINREEKFKEIIDKMLATYIAKNSDYGGSFTAIRNKFPNAILIRLNDKLARVETLLLGKKQKVSNESIDDTFLDMAVYAIMELIEREQDREYLAIIEAQNAKGVDA